MKKLLTHSRGIFGIKATTANRCLIAQCTLTFDSLRPWTSVLRVGYPRILRTGVGCLSQGPVNTAKKPVKYRISRKPGHNTAIELHSYGASEASDALHAPEPFSPAAIQAPDAIQDSASAGRVTTLQEAAIKALQLGVDANCMWNLARALKGFQEATGSVPELPSALSVWWSAAGFPRTEADVFEEYLWDLSNCFGKVKAALGTSALQIAEDSLPPLPKKPTPSQRLDRLKYLCAALQRLAGKNPFYLAYRDIGRIVGNSDPYFAQNMVAFLIRGGSLKCVEKGGGEQGRKASRYKYKL